MDEIDSGAVDEPLGPACFIDQSRVCSTDCMAHLTAPPQGAAYQGEDWAHCLLLVQAERVGRHLPILVDIVKGAAVAQRRAQSAPGVK